MGIFIRHVLDRMILGLVALTLVGAMVSTNLINTRQFGLILTTVFVLAFILIGLRVPQARLIKWLAWLKQPWFLILLVSGYQIALLIGLSTQVGYDAGTVLSTAMGAHNDYYFSVNPNNLGLLFIERVLFLLAQALGLANFKLILNGVNLVLIDAAIFLIGLTLKTYLHKKQHWSLLPLCFLLAPWIVVFYSDTAVLVFVALMILLVYTGAQRVKQPAYPLKKLIGFSLLFGGATFFAYILKPSAIIFVLAVVLELLYCLVWSPQKQYWRALLFSRRVLILFAVTWLTFGGLKLTEQVILSQQTLVSVNQEKAMLPSHFVLMGMNPKTGGGYSGADYNRSSSYPDPKSQQRANLRLIKQRLQHFGVVGYIKFLIHKNYNNSSDGTLGWSNDNQLGEPSLKQHHFIRSFFFIYGSRQAVYFVAAQIIWIGILLGVIFSWLDSSVFARSLRLSLFGTLLFLLLFEGGRSRYLIQALPMIYILAVIGWTRVGASHLLTLDWRVGDRLVTHLFRRREY
ncbi:glycosyltransferase family protein [Loigolactobacillus binensis]|uniref:Integral membrane protein n=1 Tax=Loigolactobacillus binensis TaxID=2559922 RepID=A0ABW3EGR2_9LACO|nr:hypothetical protein [Loigolactobacillus binensis]